MHMHVLYQCFEINTFVGTDPGWNELAVQHTSFIQYIHDGTGVQVAEKKWRNSRYLQYYQSPVNIEICCVESLQNLLDTSLRFIWKFACFVCNHYSNFFGFNFCLIMKNEI